MKIDAECTWGDGPDVLLHIGDQLFDLTIKEALVLAARLESAAYHADELNRMAESDQENG